MVAMKRQHGEQDSQPPRHGFRADGVEVDAQYGDLAKNLIAYQVKENFTGNAFDDWLDDFPSNLPVAFERPDLIEHRSVMGKDDRAVREHGVGKSYDAGKSLYQGI